VTQATVDALTLAVMGPLTVLVVWLVSRAFK
jgi:hypothetical protein